MSATVTSQYDLLRIADLSPDELHDLLGLADAMKADPTLARGAFSGDAVACYFAKPSTRTRASFEAAAARLGLVPIMLRPDELRFGPGESIADVARVLSAYAVAIVVRALGQHQIEAMAGFAGVPVINALTDLHHPCPVLADLMTVREHFGSFAGLKVAYLGDGGCVAHSLMEACARLGIDVALTTPPERRPDPEIMVEAEITARLHGCSVVLHDDPADAVRGADVVYADAAHATDRLLGLAAGEAVYMHGVGPQSLVIESVANRMPIAQAVLYSLIAGNERR